MLVNSRGIEAMASMLMQGIRRTGLRRNAVGQYACFHASPSLQKWNQKFKTKSYQFADDDFSPKRRAGSFKRQERAAFKKSLTDWRRTIGNYSELEFQEYPPRKKQRPRSTSTKRATDWEEFLKNEQDWERASSYEGDWEKFCSKFSKFADFEGEGSDKKKKKKKKFDWTFEDFESDDDSERSSSSSAHRRARSVKTVGVRSDRIALGLPAAGSLTMVELKAAFRASALKWHPDRHQGSESEKTSAEEKFKACGNAYKALCTALANSDI